MNNEDLTPMEKAAIHAVQPVPKTWRPYSFSMQADNGILIIGCETSFYTSGPKKGGLKYLTDKSPKTVLVTPEMSKKFI